MLFQKFHSSIKSLIIEGIQLPVIANTGLTKHIQCSCHLQGNLLIIQLKKTFYLEKMGPC